MHIKLIGIVIIIFCLISVFHPGRHAKHYNYIPVNNVLSELVESHSNENDSNLKTCSYQEVLEKNIEISITNIFEKYEYVHPQPGGEYVPQSCKPLFKVAIVIPFRKREDQLSIFLNYMHHFLQNQNIHYKIFVVDQTDSKPFNRAKMFNIGSVEAMKAEFPCLIFHDVDLIPLTSGNIYACSKRPRHMCSSLDTFRFNLPYEQLFGGVISVQAEQFKEINGMSNLFDGWGGEDDDLYRRLDTHNYTPYRFSQELSKYTMLRHKKAVPSENRYELLFSGYERQKVDGLNSLTSKYSIKEEPLYTHIIVT